MALLDTHANLAYSRIVTAPSPATSGTSIVITTGTGTLFPAVPFNATIWPTGVRPLTSNAEIVTVTNKSTDTLTITRAQEGTVARTIIVGDQIVNGITKKTLTDIETAYPLLDANGGSWTRGYASEEITLSTSGLTTDSSANLLPANSIIEAVTARVTTLITTTTNWAVGDTTTSARFSSANATLAAGTTSVGLNHYKGAVSTDAAGPTQTSAAKVRITCTGANPGAGKIRVVVFYRTFVAPTS